MHRRRAVWPAAAPIPIPLRPDTSRRLNTQATAVPVAVVSVSTILLAFYTIGKYWRQSGDTARRSMRILWLVLLNSVYNFASAMLNGTPVNASYGQQLTSYWLTVLNKVPHDESATNPLTGQHACV